MADKNQPVIIRVEPFILPLIPDFLALRRKETDSLLELAAAGDLVTLERIGHNMKGSGGAYGFEELTVIGAELERAIRAGQVDVVPALHQRLVSYLDSVVVDGLDT